MRTSLHTPSILHTACQVNSTRNHLTYGVDCKPAALQTVNKTSLQSSGMLGLTTTIPSTQQSRGRAAGYTTHDMSWKTTKYRGTTRRDMRWMEYPSPHPVTRNLGRPARGPSPAPRCSLRPAPARAQPAAAATTTRPRDRPGGEGGNAVSLVIHPPTAFRRCTIHTTAVVVVSCVGYGDRVAWGLRRDAHGNRGKALSAPARPRCRSHP